MDDMIERVARAICAEEQGGPLGYFPDGSPMRAGGVWHEYSEKQHDEWRAVARAAIKAIWTPTEAEWSGLPRAMMMWLDMSERPTPASLLKHLERTGCDIPDWLRAEPEMQSPDHVISKGTRAVMIYRAMLPSLSPVETTPEEQK